MIDQNEEKVVEQLEEVCPEHDEAPCVLEEEKETCETEQECGLSAEENICPVCHSDPCVCEEAQSEEKTEDCACGEKEEKCEEKCEEDCDCGEENEKGPQDKETECGHCEEGCPSEVEHEETNQFQEQISILLEKCNELSQLLEKNQHDFEELKSENEKLRDIVKAYEKKEFLAQAEDLIMSANFDEDIANQFMSECENGNIVDLDALKVKVALQVFDTTIRKSSVDTTSTGFSAPVSTPDLSAPFSPTPKKGEPKDMWADLREYINQ